MNIHPENIIVNSCEYTPVYLIQNPGVTQVGSYYLASSAQDVQIQKPVSDNLKRFYETSGGNLDSGVSISPKPQKNYTLKKLTGNVVGNNLKLASFLLPKSEPQQVSVSIPNNVPVAQKPVNVTVKKAKLTPVTNVVLKPTSNTNTNKMETSTSDVHVPQPPLIEVDRKIVRVGNITSKKNRFPMNSKTPLKLLPKEPLPPPPPPVTAANTAPVQLIKFGQTYHSLNQLSEDQIQIVNKALKMFSNAEAPEQPKEAIFDPEDKPKFIYKLVPAKDLSPSDRRMLLKKRNDTRKQSVKKVDRKEVKQEAKIEDEAVEVVEESPPPKVTRSGRTVKLSRHIRRAESPHKPKKKITPNTVQCCQCRNEFTSLYRLQRHYDNFPTHYPERVHSNLFHCLQAILNGCHNQAFMFVQQLEQLIDKLRTLLPCLLNKMDGVEGTPCTVTDQIGRLFGMLPGKYKLNMDALNCVKDAEGHCIHNPPPTKSESAQIRITDDSPATMAPKQDIDDCARINSVDKWPTISKRILNKKKIAEENLKAKRIRLASENGEVMELTIDDVHHEYEPQKDAVSSILADMNEESVSIESHDAAKSTETAQVSDSESLDIHKLTESTSDEQIVETNKFYSAHFDIRSSPIKLPSALVKKFQLKPEEVCSEVHILRHCTEPNNMENDNDIQILGPCNEQNSLDNIQDLQNHENINISNGETQNDNSLSHDDSFIDHMFPDNELPKEVLHELNQLSFPSSIFDSPLTKALKEVTHFDQSLEKQMLFDPSFIDSSSNQSSSKMIEPTLLLKDKVDGYFEPSAIRVKTEKPNRISKSALTQVKERSKILFEVLTDNENHNLTEQMNGHTQNVFNQFNKPISSMFDTSAIRPNGLMRPHTNNGIFESGIKHSKDDTLISSSLIDDKSNDMMVSTKMNEPSVIEKPSSIIDANLMDEKSLSDLNDARLLNNQGQSVLNFLEALESDCLSYPETDIRNNTEDFQLDLFSFSST